VIVAVRCTGTNVRWPARWASRHSTQNAELLRHPANAIAAERADREADRLLLDAATLAEIGA